MPRKKRNREEEHENTERWLVSYADFITLLFAFFVTMYAISKVDQQKLVSVAQSLQRALGFMNPAAQASILPPNQSRSLISDVSLPVPKDSEGEYFEKLAGVIQKEMERISSGNQIKYLISETGLIIRVPEQLFFDSGDASIHPEIIPILNVLGKSLEKIPNSIRVEGHTDNVPINTFRFPSNWELSTARATAIIRHLLTQCNFNPNRLSAGGYAEFWPIADNGSPEGRLQNRRVDVVILSSKNKKTETRKYSYRHPVEGAKNER